MYSIKKYSKIIKEQNKGREKRGDKMIFWLSIFVVLLIVEIATMGLTTIWFAGGALVAFFAAYMEWNLVIQSILFIVVSIGLLILTRPIAVKFFNQERQKTNVDRLIGRKAIVKEQIDTIHGVGRVEVEGMEWSARSEKATVIEPGCIVVIKEIQGVKLIVEKEEEK